MDEMDGPQALRARRCLTRTLLLDDSSGGSVLRMTSKADFVQLVKSKFANTSGSAVFATVGDTFSSMTRALTDVGNLQWVEIIGMREDETNYDIENPYFNDAFKLSSVLRQLTRAMTAVRGPVWTPSDDKTGLMPALDVQVNGPVDFSRLDLINENQCAAPVSR